MIRELPVFPLSPDPIRPEVPRTVSAVESHLEPTGAEHGPRIGLVTLGCDKNTVDSEKILAALVGHGARVSSEVDGSEVVIVNTCGFIEAAKEQSIETILAACRLKEEGKARAVVAVGCMVERYKAELAHEIPEVDLFLGLSEMQGLVPQLRDMGLLPDIGADIPNMERPLRIISTETPHTSFLKISEGCDHTCAFCAIPSFRGRHRSASLEELVLEAQALARSGVKELNIVSQDTTWYGRDLRRRDPAAPLLPDLLSALVADTDVPWYRLFYMYPSGITREVVDLIAGEPRLLPYLDMPLQHGSDDILKAMRRPERQELIRDRVGWLREAIPGLTLRTTVIVGFPGEGDEQFRDMLSLLEELRFDRVGAFTYSVEDGTPAADMPGQVPETLKRERLEELTDLQQSIAVEASYELVGTTTHALVDYVEDGGPLESDASGALPGVARTEGQAIDIDGVTHVHPHESLRPGALLPVEIVDALDYDLMARVIDGAVEEAAGAA